MIYSSVRLVFVTTQAHEIRKPADLNFYKYGAVQNFLAIYIAMQYMYPNRLRSTAK